ncbi:MAG: acetolactate synthase large subunit, partial [Actinomycetia bacterium]|nr:acetolactate synthase large subunit [Actinomycetes bacterium]
HSFNMTMTELRTAVEHELAIKVCILNNGYMGMVRQWQELFYKKCYFAVDLEAGTPDFVKLAEAYGAVGIRVKKRKDLIPALKKAIKSPCTVLLDIVVVREENIWPMVAAGQSLSDVFGGIER